MSRRQSIHIDDFSHANPIPAASRIDNMVYSGVIHGMNAGSDDATVEIHQQCDRMFAHVRNIVEAAGGTTNDIIKMTLWMKDPAQRDAVNSYWEEMFPDPESRPARHTMQADLKSGLLIQCDFIAALATD